MNFPLADKKEKHFQFFHLKIVDKRDGSWFPHDNYTTSLEDSIRLARLTFYNHDLWDVVLGESIPDTSLDDNPFFKSLSETPNPFMQSLITNKQT